MPELSPVRRRELKARAHSLKPVVLIGAAGLTPGVLDEIERSLKAHELIKLRAAGLDRGAREALLADICVKTGAQPVQQIGKILVVYRENPEASRRETEPLRERSASSRPRRTRRDDKRRPRARALTATRSARR